MPLAGAPARAVVGAVRRRAAPELAAAVEAHLAELAMASARFGVDVGDEDPGDDVTFTLAANPGAAAGPLAKVASGGELARAMLALRLVLSVAPPPTPHARWVSALFLSLRKKRLSMSVCPRWCHRRSEPPAVAGAPSRC